MSDSLFISRIRRHLPVILLCPIIFGFYQVMIYLNPAVYWYDSHIRLALHNQILVGHWLPLFQTLIFLFSKFNLSLVALRSVFSLLSIGSLIGLYLLGGRLFSRPVGIIALVFLSLNTMFAALATVFYPDVLFVGLSFFTLYLLDQPASPKAFYLGIAALSLAGLTRYEGWLLSALFIGETILRSFSTLNRPEAIRQVIKMTVLCGLAPFGWVMLGFPESGGFLAKLKDIAAFESLTSPSLLSEHISSRLNLEYLGEFSREYFHILKWQIHPEFLILAGLGFSVAWVHSSERSIHWRILIFLVLDYGLWAISQQRGFGNLRQPFLLQAFLVLYAAYGLPQGISWACQRISLLISNANAARWAPWLTVALTVLLSLRMISPTTRFIAASSRETDFLVPYKVSAWLNPRMTKEDIVLVLDDTDFYSYALGAYMRYPFQDILDDRLDAQSIQSGLKTAKMVYIVQLYKSRDGLAPTEEHILEDLESDRIQAEKSGIDVANVWYVPADQIVYSP